MELSNELKEQRKQLDETGKKISLNMARHKIGILIVLLPLLFAGEISLITLVPMALAGKITLWCIALAFALLGISSLPFVIKNLVHDKKDLNKLLDEEQQYYLAYDKQLEQKAKQSIAETKPKTSAKTKKVETITKQEEAEPEKE